METRGRGREARASTDDTRSQPNSNLNNSNAPLPQQPATRSRSRRTSSETSQPSIRAPRTRRTTRASTSSTPSSRRPPTQTFNLTNHSITPTSASDRPRRGQPSRRTTANQSSGNSDVEPSIRTTRKRTRSSHRTAVSSPQRNPVVSSSAAALTNTAGPTSILSSSASRPSKRQRRAPYPTRSLRPSQGSSAGPSLRQSRGMSSAGAGDSGQRSHGQNGQQRDGEGPSSFGSDRAGPTTLQGLLRRLGADLSDIFPGNSGSSHSRLQQLRNAIASPESTEQQLEALSDLCEFLSVGTEESMVSFSVNLFVGPLVNLLRTGTNIEVKIYAARALTHMMEALPSSSSAIAINGAAGPLCQNLLAIEYIDLAEQSLSALHKLSVDYPQQIVSSNGFQAVLSFIEFFSIGMQRLAASTACNLCRSPRSDAMDKISGVLPTMMMLLESDDQRIRESAVLGFTRLAEAFRNSSEKLELLSGSESVLIERIFRLVVPPSPPALTPQSYSSALRLLATLSRGSAKLGLQIISTKSLIEKLKAKLSSDTSGHAIDCLSLADSLLPEMPETEPSQNQPRTRRPRRSTSSVPASVAVDVKRREDLEQNMNALQFFGQSLFETLMKFYISSADSNARRVALCVMSKFIAISSPEVLADIVGRPSGTDISGQRAVCVRFCPFVAALLGENSTPNEALVGLAMATSALQKLPSLRDSFFREGVVHEIMRLAATTSKDDDEVRPVSMTSTFRERGPSGSGGSLDVASSSASDFIMNSAELSDPDAIWSAISSLQRGGLYRSGRGDSFSNPSRPLGRSVPEFRSTSVHPVCTLVSKAAHSILRVHLGANSDGTLNENVFKNNALGKLTDLCNSLSNLQDVRDSTAGCRAVQALVRLLVSPERLTTFEVTRSGTMSALAKFLSPSNESLVPNRVQTLVKCLNTDRGKGAFSSLVELSLGALASEEKLPLQISDFAHNSSSSPVSTGLRHLSQPLKLRLRKATAENGGAGLRDYAHHVVLIEPLATMASVQEFLWPRVREVDCSASAGAASAQRRRSSRGDRSQRESAVLQDNDSVSLDRAEIDDNHDEEYEERFAVEEMFDMDDENPEEDPLIEDEDEHNSDGSDEDVSSGDEDMIEHDVVESDDNDNDGPESMDVDQLSRSMPPFELDHDALGQAPARGTNNAINSSAGRGGSTPRVGTDSSRHDSAFRSYAAALAANMQRSATSSLGVRHESGTAIASGREDRRRGRHSPVSPKLSFSLNGRDVAQDCSILSAVIQASAEPRTISSRLWSEVHVLVYSKASEEVDLISEDGVDGGTNNARVSLSGSENGGRLRRSQRLQESRLKTSVGDSSSEHNTSLEDGPSDEVLKHLTLACRDVPVPRQVSLAELPTSVAEITDVLRHLHWIFTRIGERILRLEGAPIDVTGLLESGEIEFLSHKLSAKVLRQLSDPLALSGGLVPDWCFALARDAPFLMPFETRRILFQSTSLGVARALHCLQTRTDISGVASSANRSPRSHREEARVSRLQRQKVRVHRQRILESAIKVMNFYSTHNTVLEVQYFDEAGIGLGPTLEFYTMASRELQRIDLRLWRGSSDKVPKQKEIGGSISAANRINQALMTTGRTSSKRRSRRLSQSSGGSTSDVKELDEAPAFVIPTGGGLFPSCLPMVGTESQKETTEMTTSLFGFVGRLLGKALVDGRLVDLRLSATFARLLFSYCRVIHEERKARGMQVDTEDAVEICGPGDHNIHEEIERINREEVWNIYTSGRSTMKLLEDVDVQLTSSLKTILKMVEGNEQDAISALCLTFVLPGDDNIELAPGGSNIDVTNSNAEEFVRRVVYHVLFGGVYQQAEALLKGLGDLIDVTRLLMFRSNELELLSCGPAFEKWTVEFLIEATRCDHGYSHESPAVLYFLQILSEFDQMDQQKFVLFTTGSPALPLGGLRNLHPRLTIVRRTPEAGRSPDECLPTVMTCTNYFKLPDYSSFEVAKRQIMYAVREGQRSFHLS